jgi:thiol-disulfide isomerase/thioredoxin
MVLPALLFFAASLVNDVRGSLAHHDAAAAERAVRAYQAQSGATAEFAAALSWLARGALDSKDYDQADAYAAETRKTALELLRTRKLDADTWLPTALGASIEVHAQVLRARGEVPEALAFLRGEIRAYGATSMGERIRKNINLIDLEGKPAPPLDERAWLGPRPDSLASLRGRPVLLFFWAHWCPDCKAEAPVIAKLWKTYGPRGLAVIGPTKYYGYTARGEDAAPAAERPYIERVRQQYYAALAEMPVPISAENFARYGASTTPTLVLIDAAGMVRFYHPGSAPEADLAGRIEALLRK